MVLRASRGQRKKKGGLQAQTVSTAAQNNLPKLSNLTREEVICQYHTLLKQLAAVDNDCSFPTIATKEARKNVLRAQLKVIGMENYQDASRAGELKYGGFDSSQWVLGLISKRNDIFALASASTASLNTDGDSASPTMLPDSIGFQSPQLMLRLLDVGSIVHRFPDSVEREDGEKVVLSVTSIDLHPAIVEGKQSVLQADIVTFVREHFKTGVACFDGVIMSLCVNFEGCPWKRGEMIYYATKILKPGGLLFLVLPLQCVRNSRYCDEETLQMVLKFVQLRVVSKESTAALLMWTAAKHHHEGGRTPEFNSRGSEWLSKKRLVRTGAHRNNFAICLRPQLIRNLNAPDVPQSTEKSSNLDRNQKQSEQQKSSGKGMQSRIGKKKSTSNQRKRTRRRLQSHK